MMNDAQAKDFDNFAYCNVIINATDTAGEFTFDNLALTKANMVEIIAYIDKTILIILSFMVITSICLIR